MVEMEEDLDGVILVEEVDNKQFFIFVKISFMFYRCGEKSVKVLLCVNEQILI